MSVIASLLALAAGDCLPVGEGEILRRLGEFEVARAPSGTVVGCAAVRGERERAELRCLAVHPGWRGAGVGRLLVERAMQRAFAAGEALFCVSRKPTWFESLGFSRLPASEVPDRPGAVPAGRHALIRRREHARLKKAI
ncbi:MAG: GNAT family N-acetyltransferase [Planctomycetes bacterium]|nr:GNAT family N-acetyltransferase [Planctomycetota bacterium]